MKYYSINRKSPVTDFKTATIKGQAPDKGLYFPESLPVLPKEFIQNISSYSNEEIAFQVIQPYVKDCISDTELHRIVEETVNFDIPLVKVNDHAFSLELYHGPTLAFKDVGARFMSRCLSYFVQHEHKRVTVLVATSGDTGGAVANGFYGVENVDVVILYPSKKVSSIQELQLTSLGKNVHALEVDGTFDDCQKMVKQAFADADLNDKLFLTSANSINVARWLPQQFYYFYAWKQWPYKDQPMIISVPSGNFGNICAGLLARHSGLPVQQFIAACNANDVIINYLKTGNYEMKPAVATISNAMDVGHPSNFVRILELFDQQYNLVRNYLTGYSISDEETRTTIKEVYNNDHYIADPHGAVGYLALKKYLCEHGKDKGIFLETAHPIKFYDVVEPILHKVIDMPDQVKDLLHQQKNSVQIKAEYETLKEFLLVNQKFIA